MSYDTALYLYEEFLKNNNQNQCLQFFRRSPHGYLVMLLIYTHQIKETNLSMSDIYKNIPDKIASDLTLLIW